MDKTSWKFLHNINKKNTVKYQPCKKMHSFGSMKGCSSKSLNDETFFCLKKLIKDVNWENKIRLTTYQQQY